MLELHFIGVPEVVLDGHPVTFARRGSIGLLAFLVYSGTSVARELLLTLLAGDSSDEQARKYLSNLLIDLRQNVGEYVFATRYAVAFAQARPHHLDVAEFQQHVAGLGDRDQPEGVLEQAMALYRGEFLAGLNISATPDFDAWLQAQREELRGQYIQVLQAEIERCLRTSDWSSGVRAARRLIAEEPWLEDAHYALMLMLGRSGQHQAALAQYQSCRRVLREEVGLEPQPETTALFNRLRAAAVRPTHNLPAQAAPLIGRAGELLQLTTLMTDPDCRLATITGLGGSGKTRLAIEVGRAFASHGAAVPAEQPFPDGIVFVPLADAPPAARTQERLLCAIQAALGLAAQPASSHDVRQRIMDHVQSKALLLIADNMEDFAPGAGVLQDLLTEAPYMKVLVTASAPLHLAGERVLILDGLPLPSDADGVESSDACTLFLGEARRVHVGFELPVDERPQLVELCRSLGGLPLALMLAARWSPLMSCARIQAGGVEVLETQELDLPERQRSITSVLERTLEGLKSADRALVESLADGFGELPEAMLPRAKTLHDRGLMCATADRRGVRLHPLLQRYLRCTSMRTVSLAA